MAAYYAKKLREKEAKAQRAYDSIVKAGEFLGQISGNGVEGAKNNNNQSQDNKSRLFY